MRRGIRKQNVGVGFGRWDVYVAKVRSTFGIKVNPQRQPFDRQVFKIDVASQVERIKILDADGGQQSIDLAELFTRLGIVEFDAEHFDRLQRKSGIKLSDFRTHPIRDRKSTRLNSSHVEIS